MPQQTDVIEISKDPASGCAQPQDRRRRGRLQLRVDAEYQALVQPISDLARELGDEATNRASVTRAYHLMREAAVPIGDFLHLLSEAKALTRAHQAGITKIRGDAGPLPRKNLMPYFFATLDSLLHPDDHPPQQQEARSPQRRPLRTRRPTHDATSSDRMQSSGHATLHEVLLADATPLQPVETHPIWRAVLDELSLILTPENFNTWLARTRVVSHEGDVLRVAVPKAFHKDWLDNKLRGRIENTLQRLDHGNIQVEFVVVAE